jgi:hypothetical protein
VLTLAAIGSLPDVYALACAGHCMEPEVVDGSVLVFDKIAVVRPGDVAVIWNRPRATAGQAQGFVRRIVMGPPPDVDFPFRRNVSDADAPQLLVRQCNPKRCYPLACTGIVALHRCVGATEPDRRRQAIHVLEAA